MSGSSAFRPANKGRRRRVRMALDVLKPGSRRQLEKGRRERGRHWRWRRRCTRGKAANRRQPPPRRPRETGTVQRAFRPLLARLHLCWPLRPLHLVQCLFSFTAAAHDTHSVHSLLCYLLPPMGCSAPWCERATRLAWLSPQVLGTFHYSCFLNEDDLFMINVAVYKKWKWWKCYNFGWTYNFLKNISL
jgi:hypothetical protein